MEGTYKHGNYVVTIESIVPNLGLLREYKPMIKEYWREGLFDDLDKRYFRLIDRSTDMVGVVERRDKMGFPVPLKEWFGGPLKGFVSEIFDQQRSRRRDYFNTDVVLADFQAVIAILAQDVGASEPGTVASTLP
jgi:hypothetical protein